MNFKRTYRVSPNEEIVIDGNTLYPTEVYHMGVTMFGTHYIGIQSDRDCRIVQYTKINKNDLSKFSRKENCYD